MPPLTVDISEIGQLARPWQLELMVLAVQRDAASASSLAAIHAGTGPPEGSRRRVSRGLATSSFGWSGAHADYTTRMNLKVKILVIQLTRTQAEGTRSQENQGLRNHRRWV